MTGSIEDTCAILELIEKYFGSCSGCKNKLPLDPKLSYLLPCLHTSCQECFKGNISVSDCCTHALMDEVAPNLMTLEVAVLQEKKCGNCARKGKLMAARWYCEGCSLEICDDCYAAHEQLASILACHPRVLIDNRAAVDSTLTSLTKCSTHPNQLIQMLCCGVLVCRQCTSVDGPHHSHLNRRIGEVTQETLSQLAIWIEDSQRNLSLIHRCLNISLETVESMRAVEERVALQVSEALDKIELPLPITTRKILLLIQQQFDIRRGEIEVEHHKLKFRLESTERVLAFMTVLCNSQMHCHAVLALNFVKMCLSRNLEPINLVPILDVTPPVNVDCCLAELNKINRILQGCIQHCSKYKPATIARSLDSPFLPSCSSHFPVTDSAAPAPPSSCNTSRDPSRSPAFVCVAPENNVDAHLDASHGAFPEQDVELAQSLLELAQQPRRKGSCSDRASMTASSPSIAVDWSVMNFSKRSGFTTPEGTISTPNWDNVGLADGAPELFNSGLVDEHGWLVLRYSEEKPKDLMAVKNELVYCKVLMNSENVNLPMSDHPCRSHSQNLNPTSTLTEENVLTLTQGNVDTTENTALPIASANLNRKPPSSNILYPNASDAVAEEPFVLPIPESSNAGGPFDVVNNTSRNNCNGVDNGGFKKVSGSLSPFKKLAAIAKEAAKSIQVGVERNESPSYVVSDQNSGTLSQSLQEENAKIRDDSNLEMHLRPLEDIASMVSTINTLESISGTAAEVPVRGEVCPELVFSDRIRPASSSPFDGFSNTSLNDMTIDVLDKDVQQGGSNNHYVPAQEDGGNEAPPVKRKRGRPKKCNSGTKPASKRKRHN